MTRALAVVAMTWQRLTTRPKHRLDAPAPRYRRGVE